MLHSTASSSLSVKDPTLASMIEEMAKAPEIYQPSSFWSFLNETNLSMLDEVGLDRFKQTVAQNYYNWMITSPRDNQFQSVFRRWVRHPSLNPVLNEFKIPDVLRTLNSTEKTLRRRNFFVYKLYVGMLWEYSRRGAWSGLTDALEEPTVGAPIDIRRKGKRISQDLANSIREYHAILEGDRSAATRPKRVAELGAGYGRLAQVFLATGSTQYFIFDIPPALHVSQWYLSKVFPGKKVFSFRHIEDFNSFQKELESCDVAFFTPNQLALFPERWFDYFVSISTLPEMSAAQISHYLELINSHAGKYIYMKQWLHWKNPRDGNEVFPDTFSFPAPWDPVYDRRDAIQDLFAERLWRRS